MFGNGLRSSIWTSFQERFNIPDIVEFYAATEGNCNVCNITNQVGCTGYIIVGMPWFIKQLQPMYVIKVDDVTGEPVRNSDGLCIECEPGTNDNGKLVSNTFYTLLLTGEPGEFIGKIVVGHPVKDFKGYKDSSSTSKKILCDTFAKGDKYFRSGDIMAMDEFGHLFFKDRAGDTFR
jgi:solute carrier family 27 fatty acid transporter 1/4